MSSLADFLMELANDFDASLMESAAADDMKECAKSGDYQRTESDAVSDEQPKSGEEMEVR